MILNHKVEVSYEVEEINSGKIEIRGKRSVGADVVTSLGEFPSIRSKQSFYLHPLEDRRQGLFESLS